MIGYFHEYLDRGFEITYRSSDDSNLQIVKYGEYIYDHIILFAPATKGKREWHRFHPYSTFNSTSQNSEVVWMPKL